VLTLKGSADSMRVSNYFSSDAAGGYQVEQIRFADGSAWDIAAVKASLLTGTADSDSLIGYATADTIAGQAGDDTIYGRAGNDTLDGGSGADYLSGEAGDDVLLGGAQDDTLNGDAGNDTLDGGTGNDTLSGGTGNDTYLFGKGSGKDTVSSYDSTVGKLDVVQLGAGITAADVALTRESDTLVLSLKGSTDSLRVSNYFSSDAAGGYQVEQIRFADGSAWDIAAVKASLLNGADGNDSLIGYASADVLSGLAGEDVLDARAGNDTLDGGAGSDTLIGGTGNDTYLMGRGYGADIVQENDATAGNADVLQFLPGVTSDQLWFRHVGNDLEVSIIGTADKATLQNWYSGSQYHVEQFKTSDGKTLLDSKVQELVSAMAAFTPPALGQTTLPTDYQTTLLPIVAADWGP